MPGHQEPCVGGIVVEERRRKDNFRSTETGALPNDARGETGMGAFPDLCRDGAWRKDRDALPRASLWV